MGTVLTGETKMRIAFSGAQSSGKTTLIKALQKDPKFQHFNFFTEITRGIQAQGFSINEAGTDATQLEIMMEHLRRLQAPGDNIYDRCSLDGAVYTDYLYYQHKLSTKTFSIALNIFQSTIADYDYIFYTDANIPLEDDAVRSTSKEFRNEIIFTFEHYIKDFQIPVIPLVGSVEERLKTVREVLNESHR